MEKKFLKISTECVEHILSVSNGLAQIETRGDSTILMAKLRDVLSYAISEMQVDNAPKKEEIVVDNTTKKKE